jgi:hypothetical protein
VSAPRRRQVSLTCIGIYGGIRSEGWIDVGEEQIELPLATSVLDVH